MRSIRMLFAITLSLAALSFSAEAAPKRQRLGVTVIPLHPAFFCTRREQAKQVASLMTGARFLKSAIETVNERWGAMECEFYDGVAWLVKEIEVRNTYMWRIGIYKVRVPWSDWQTKYLVVMKLAPKA